jgi:hypothetical protein
METSPKVFKGRGNKPKPPEVRFWKRVKKVDGCWLWRGGKGDKGKVGPPGRLVIDGHQVGVRRFSYELHFGVISPGKHVLPTCGNPWCIRPDHLVLGRSTGGDHPGGAASPRAKLTEEQVSAIRDGAAKGEVLRALADDYGISHVQVWRIVAGNSWKS